jgi:hypothetical protein
MKEHIYIAIITLFILYTIHIYLNNINKEESKYESDYTIIDIDSYFYSDSYVKESKKRKIWIHIPFEKNSRKWSNFGSRTSTDLNLAYMTLCIKSIIDTCGDTYDIIIFDDTNIPQLIDTEIDILKLSGALKDKYRELCLLQIIYDYGGIIVPPSLYLKKSLKIIDKTDIWYVVEITNQDNVSYSDMIQSTLFTGSNIKNAELNKYIKHHSEQVKNDFGEHSLHYNKNYLKQNNISYIDGKIIGTKDQFDKPILLEDLMENKIILLDKNNIGLFIPHSQLIKRRKYNWYCSLSTEETLKSHTFISRYMLSK